MKKNSTFEFDSEELAEKFTEFNNGEQLTEAREKLTEYLEHLSYIDSVYASEIMRRIQRDDEFKNQMMNSFVQLSCLLTAAIVETAFDFNVTFEVVKRKSKNDSIDVCLFKEYLLNTFSIHDIEEEMGFFFSTEQLENFHQKNNMIKEYFILD